MTPQDRRIGVFGGAFDPPHLAHAALIHQAIRQLALDEVRVIPTGAAWHKPRALSPAAHRVAMARLAFSSLPGVVVDERETRRAGPSFTIDTLLELRAEHPLAELFLIIGGDQARSLSTWHRWQEVAQNAIICVANREYHTGASGGFDAKFVPPPLLEHRFLHLKTSRSPISATAIRAHVANRESITSLVGEPVARYIAQHHLYHEP